MAPVARELWVPNRYECTDFVTDVLRAEAGVEIALPRPARHIAQRDVQVARCLSDGPYARTGVPGELDGVLMRSKHGVRLAGWHIGLHVDAAGPHVLHLYPHGGSVLTRVAELEAIGMKLEGYYRWQ